MYAFFIDCYLDSVGKPIFHAHANTYYGAWMRDAYPRSGQVFFFKILLGFFKNLKANFSITN